MCPNEHRYACSKALAIMTNNNNKHYSAVAAAAPVTVLRGYAFRVRPVFEHSYQRLTAAAVRVSVPVGRPRSPCYRYRVVVVVVEAGRYLSARRAASLSTVRARPSAVSSSPSLSLPSLLSCPFCAATVYNRIDNNNGTF